MASMPSTLDFSTTQPSYLKKFIVSVTSSLDPIAINTMHGWEILVKTPEGAPVDNAKISAIGGMPVHQHGLPTAPRVTKNLGDGRYRLEGVKFNMAGWWELKIKIDTGSDQDTATFNLILR
ncbi:MAG: FixH family protein [Rhodospirillales bacterium]|nr:FixH family protein [Rhodospirillales bacterium]